MNVKIDKWWLGLNNQKKRPAWWDVIRKLKNGEVDDAAPKKEVVVSKFLIVGLGNMGEEYEGTRHNIGFKVLDKLAEKHHISLGRVQQRAIVGSGQIAGQGVLLAKPQTYMNRSGESVGALSRFFKIPSEHLIVVYDDLDLDLGTVRIRHKGGTGGHNGMKSLIEHLGRDFPRIRLGIGRPPGRMSAAAYVLQRFSKDDKPIVEMVIQEAVEAIETFLSSNLNNAMNQHNKKL